MKKSNKSTKGVLITIDESGTPRNNFQGDYFTVVATVVDNRERFRDAVERLNLDHEIGYADNKNYTKKVIKHSLPAVKKAYAVPIKKTYNENGKEKKIKEYFVEGYGVLKDYVPEMEKEPLLIMVDSSKDIDPREVQRIFVKKKDERDSKSCVVVPSNWFPELQTNDYYTGIIASVVNNKPIEEHVKLLKNKYVIKDNNRKTNRGGTSKGMTHSPSKQARPQGRVSAPCKKNNKISLNNFSLKNKTKIVKKKPVKKSGMGKMKGKTKATRKVVKPVKKKTTRRK